MKVLLDAHTFLWFGTDDAKLSKLARSVIENPQNEKLVSIATAWEMAIKASLGKLTLSAPIGEILQTALADSGYELLPIEVDHVAKVATLAFHHRDPFDRILIAQSLIEDIQVISVDEAFDAYGVERIW